MLIERKWQDTDLQPREKPPSCKFLRKWEHATRSALTIYTQNHPTTNVVRIMRDVREEEAAHEGEEEAKEKESSGGEHAADGRAVTSVFTMYTSTSIYQVTIP